MKELIQINVADNKQLVSARELYKALGLKKRFSAWVKQNFKEFELGFDYTNVPQGTVVKSGNGTVRKYDDYALSLDMAKELCMMSHSKHGKEYRKYFIEVERKWNDPQEVLKRASIIDSHILSDELAIRNRELAFKERWLSEMEAQNANKRAELLIKLANRAVKGSLRNDLLNEAMNQVMLPVQGGKAFPAGVIAEELGVSAYQVGIWGQKLGLKAPKGMRNDYGYWKNGQYFYNEQGVKSLLDHKEEIMYSGNFG